MLDKLSALLIQADSHSAEYAAVLRLARAHELIAAGVEDIALGIIYYVLDPMICMGVENVAHIDTFLHHQTLREMLCDDNIQQIKRFITGHSADIAHMIAFISAISDSSPQKAPESEAKTLIRTALLRHCDGIGEGLAQIIVDDVYARNSWMWG